MQQHFRSLDCLLPTFYLSLCLFLLFHSFVNTFHCHTLSLPFIVSCPLEFLYLSLVVDIYLSYCFLSFSTCLSIPLFHFYSSHSHWNQSVAISLSHYDFCVDSILQTSSSSFPEWLPRFLSYFFSILSFTFYRFLVSLSPCQVSFFLPFCLMIPKTSFLAPGPFSLLLSLSLL